MATHREYRSYSPYHDSDVVRLSMVDERNGEFYMIIPTLGGGKPYREARQRALDAIALAIDEGHEPGRVHIVVRG